MDCLNIGPALALATTADPQTVGLALGLGALAIALLIIFIKANLVICEPNEVVIISGRRRTGEDGVVRGYRVIKGGRGFKFPILETVSRLSLVNLPIEIHIRGALSAGVIPIDVAGRANVKIAGSPEQGLDFAIERFLGRDLTAVASVAKETLEAALRASISSFTPEDANGKRREVAADVEAQAGEKLQTLGLLLDFFQVQSVSDSQGYLEAIGRRKTAEVARDAKIAEATAEAESRKVTADQQRVGRLAEVDAHTAVIEAENRLAVHKAELEAKSRQAEQRAQVAGEIARVEEEQRLEEGRKALNLHKYEAKTVIPARAQSEAAKLEAQGRAAKILERGKATAEAVQLMREQWQDEGSRDLFLIQMFPELVDKITRTVADNLRIEKLTVLDSGNGEALPNAVKNVTKSAMVILEQVKNATGVDLPDLVQKAGNKSAPAVLPKDLKD